MVYLEPAQFDGFYNGYCNGALESAMRPVIESRSGTSLSGVALIQATEPLQF